MSNRHARVNYGSESETSRQLATSINRAIQQTPFNTVKTVTASYTAAEYNVILCDCTAGAITISLPRAADYNGSYTIKKVDSTANAVTVDGFNSETIDGNTTIVWAVQYDSYTIVPDDTKTKWYIV